MNPFPPDQYAQLPGGEYLVQGLADVLAGKPTLSALVLSIAATRLREAGVPVPSGTFKDPEWQLFTLLEVECGDGDEAHSQYNAHLRRLTSLCRALENARRAAASA